MSWSNYYWYHNCAYLFCANFRRYYNVHSNPKFVAGVQSEETILKQFVDHFQEHGDKSGVVTREDFDNYYAAISASVDNDMFFDLMVRQVYKL